VALLTQIFLFYREQVRNKKGGRLIILRLAWLGDGGQDRRGASSSLANQQLHPTFRLTAYHFPHSFVWLRTNDFTARPSYNDRKRDRRAHV
jgi:hypothetical protein